MIWRVIKWVNTFVLVEISKLKEHEEIIPERFDELKNEILSSGFLKEPIVVDKNTNIILDGHHRFNIFKSLGYSKIAVQYVDYGNPKIVVDSWNGNLQTKEKVIEKVVSGEKFPPKTTKHMIPNRIRDLVIPLKSLK
ncbi:MAG: hypothetical protein GF368_01315 [Candidatus Aenigmarchaeota archaeon]|nr:hypothetical protein [Candidatus Aenigmarchaeota archaeon]